MLGELAREMKVATEMGNQGTANSGLREAAAIVQGGHLGNVTEVHVWTNRPIWAQGGERPKEEPVPKNLHWEEWIGPAPYRPYAKGYHPFAWRGWWDFGTGALGDMACHTYNMPFAALNLRDPVSVEAQSAGTNKDSYPKWSQIVYEFPANDKRGPVKVTWYDGGKKPPVELVGLKPGEKLDQSGSLLIGDKGKIYSPGDYCDQFRTIGFEKPKVEFTKSPGHFEEWVRAIKGGPQAMSNFHDYAGPLTETILLGNLAVWATGKKVEWDAKNMVPKNAPECEPIVRIQYRSGYTL
jgi:predicted dehydrogenase